MIDFDGWRTMYPTMTFADQVDWYGRTYSAYPDQFHFDAGAVSRFITWAQPHHILEIGGWRGELAGEMLPHFLAVKSWINYEISPGAVANTVCTDPRYRGQVPPDWPWKMPDLAKGTDTFVASHVIEHMRSAELEALLRLVGAEVDSIYLASPLDDGPKSWEGYQGTHILEIGWAGVDEILADLAFIEHEQFRTPEVRCYWTPRG